MLESKDERIVKLQNQIEFYFSDANLTKDKFMRETAAKSEDGIIPYEILLTFKRIQLFIPIITIDEIKESLKDSLIVKVTEFGLKKIETEEFLIYKSLQTVDERTLYLKNFPKSYKLEDISKSLKGFDFEVKVKRILMRRNLQKKFSGSCLVEFGSEEEAAKVLGSELYVDPKEEEVEDLEKDGKTEEVKEDIVKTEDVKEDTVKTEDAVKTEDTVKTEDAVKTEDVIKTEDAVKTEDTVKTEDVVKKEEPLNDSVKRIKTGKIKIEILKKKDLKTCEQNQDLKLEKLAKKIKLDYKNKLYKIENLKEDDSIQSIKKIIKNAAFVDFKNKAIRMKYQTEEKELQFKEYKLIKMTSDEADEYLTTVNIKPVIKDNKRRKESHGSNNGRKDSSKKRFEGKKDSKKERK